MKKTDFWCTEKQKTHIKSFRKPEFYWRRFRLVRDKKENSSMRCKPERRLRRIPSVRNRCLLKSFREFRKTMKINSLKKQLNCIRMKIFGKMHKIMDLKF